MRCPKLHRWMMIEWKILLVLQYNHALSVFNSWYTHLQGLVEWMFHTKTSVPLRSKWKQAYYFVPRNMPLPQNAMIQFSHTGNSFDWMQTMGLLHGNREKKQYYGVKCVQKCFSKVCKWNIAHLPPLLKLKNFFESGSTHCFIINKPKVALYCSYVNKTRFCVLFSKKPRIY